MRSTVESWLESLGLGKHTEIFAENLIDFEVLPELTDEDLRDLLALFFRYAAPMHQFRAFLTDTNEAWFRDNKSAFWHSKVFQNEETNLRRDA